MAEKERFILKKVTSLLRATHIQVAIKENARRYQWRCGTLDHMLAEEVLIFYVF